MADLEGIIAGLTSKRTAAERYLKALTGRNGPLMEGADDVCDHVRDLLAARIVGEFSLPQGGAFHTGTSFARRVKKRRAV